MARTTLPVTSWSDGDLAIVCGELSTVPSAASTGARGPHAASSTNRWPACSPGKMSDGVQLTNQVRLCVTSCSWPWYFHTWPVAMVTEAVKRACAVLPSCVTWPSARWRWRIPSWADVARSGPATPPSGAFTVTVSISA